MLIKGISDEVTQCECCGKKNLKCTVVLTNGEGEQYFGRDCAAKAIRPVKLRDGRIVSSITANQMERWAIEAKIAGQRAELAGRPFAGLKK